MRLTLFLPAVLLLCLGSCTKNAGPDAVDGRYTETSPFAGRSQLNFISGNIVVKSEPGSSNKDSFRYALSPGKIQLTPAWTNQYPAQQFDFEKIDNNTIKIENLYAAIPEAPKTYMIFKK